MLERANTHQRELRTRVDRPALDARSGPPAIPDKSLFEIELSLFEHFALAHRRTPDDQLDKARIRGRSRFEAVFDLCGGIHRAPDSSQSGSRQAKLPCAFLADVADANGALEQLYAVEPEQFVAERRRLERSLRDEGRTEEAEEAGRSCQSRRSPSTRRIDLHATVLTILPSSSRQASGLQRRTGQGTLQELREAQADLTDLVTTLVRHAGELSDAIEQRLATLLAGGCRAIPTTAPLLRRGVLSEEVEPTAFDALAWHDPRRA